MAKRRDEEREPPGAAPRVQGYWAFVEGRPRKPPDWHRGHTQEWKRLWLEGYDDADRISERRIREDIGW